MNPAKLLPICLLALVAGTCSARVDAAPQLNQDIPWQNDIERAKEIAAQEDKLVLLHFGASWCRPCQSLETFVFTSKKVQDVIAANVVPVKLDADDDTAAVNEYDVQMVPYDVIIAPSGRVVSRRRSPADASNYALMISKLSTANRKLKDSEHGNLGHQIRAVQSRYDKLQAEQKGDFRPEAPTHENIGLSKDGSLLARRQSAFGDDPKAEKNPWVAPKTASTVRTKAQPWSASEPSWDDMDRKQFLKQQQQLPAQGVARRVEPQRILNPSYFESVKNREQNMAQSKPSAPRKAPSFEIVEETADPDPAPMQLAEPMMSAQPKMAMAEDRQFTSGSTTFQPKLPAAVSAPATLKRKEPVAAAFVAEEKKQVAAEEPAAPLDRSKFCLYGKCPVTLIREGRWVDGDAKFGIIHRDRVFLFANAESLAEFKRNPDQLSPILAGFDPVVYHENGKLIDGVAENGVFMGKAPEHQVILFSSADSRAKFQSNPTLYLGTVRQAMQKVAPANGGTIVR